MSSRFGPRAAGTDGNDFKHRQRVAAQYQISASYKFYLKALFGLHFTVLLGLWAKVFGEIATTQFGLKSALLKRLDLPTAYPWEYVWCLSFVPIVIALYAMPKNKVKPMTIAYYSQFFFGVLPCCIGLGSQFPELIAYIQDPSRADIPTVRDSFPMVVVWFIFFLIAFQLHIFGMFFQYHLIEAWSPATSTPAKEDEKKTDKKSD
uniref:Protein jagunal n=1 Tax=Panagrellus redivivus TaxID=6233 RepID=A0A7E4UPC6_PANRE